MSSKIEMLMALSKIQKCILRMVLFEIQNWKIRDIFCKDSLLPSSKLYLKKLHSIQTRKGEQNSKAWKLKKMPGYAEFQWHTSKYPILLKTLDIDGAVWNSKLDISNIFSKNMLSFLT